MTAEKPLPRVGSKLADGAIVLAAYTNANGQRYVLADNGGVEGYATWRSTTRATPSTAAASAT
jgi:hypothetical protein